jgi:hypothetical protein
MQTLIREGFFCEDVGHTARNDLKKTNRKAAKVKEGNKA